MLHDRRFTCLIDKDRDKARGIPDGNGWPKAHAPLNASAVERINESTGAAERFNGAAERIKRKPTDTLTMQRVALPIRREKEHYRVINGANPACADCRLKPL